MTEYKYRRRVQFAEADMAGIVHFANYLKYVEEAEHALWRAAGLSIVPAGGQYSFPRVAASLEFHAPLHFEEEFEVHIKIAERTRRSIRYTTEITRGELAICSGVHTAVCVRRHSQPLEAVAIPTEIVDKLS